MKTENAPVMTIALLGWITSIKFPEIGTVVGLITIICLIPVMVKRWRNMIFDYRVYCANYQVPFRFLSFNVLRFLLNGQTKSTESGAPFTD